MPSLLDYFTGTPRSLLNTDVPRLAPGGLVAPDMAPDSSMPSWADALTYWRDQLEEAQRQGISGLLAPAANTEYGNVLPIARDTDTGALRPALPAGLRDTLRGLYDLTQGPGTGTVTPEGTMALLSLVDPLARPQPGVLGAFSGSQRAMREAAAAERAKSTGLLDDVVSATERPPGAPATPASLLDTAVAKTEATQAPSLLGDTPMLKQIVSDGVRNEDRVSTAIPTAAAKKGEPVPIDPHTTSGFRINIDTARAAPDTFARNAMNLRDGDFPDLPVKGLRNPDSIANTAMSHMADNLVWLHDQMRDTYGQDTVDRAANWYDGAHQIALRLADQTGYSPRQVATVMAALSPQKDWFQNADMADRLIDIVKNQGQAAFSPEMRQWGQDYVAQKQAEIAKDRAKGKDSTADGKAAALGDLQMRLNSFRDGQTLGEINDPETRAVFARAYDEAHHARSYPIITPEGNFGPVATNDDGSPSSIGWGSFKEIGKALDALSTDDPAQLSLLLGGNHKVRSFFNNIISPNSQFDDTTIDTHAINAAHLRPMGGSHPVVSFGLGTGGGSSSNATGSKGGYGLYHEAYRQATDVLNQRRLDSGLPGDLLPRQLQSITWEAVRGLFTPEQKRDPALVADVNGIWRQARNGQITADDARSLILNRVNRIEPPDWYKPPAPPTPDEEPTP